MPISIIVASYNYERFIGRTLASLISQTWRDWEAIVVDDGSTDGSIDVIREYVSRDPRIKLFTHEGGENRGLINTIRLGMTHCSGEWVAFCESDDWWEPDCLEKRMAYLSRYPEAEFIFNEVFLEGEQKIVCKVKGAVGERFRQSALADMRAFYPDCNPVVTFSCAMLKKSLLERCDFDSPVPMYLDCWLWSQIAFEAPFLLVAEPLTHWLQHEESYTRRGKTRRNKRPSLLLGQLRKGLQELLTGRYPERKAEIFWRLRACPFFRMFTGILYQRRIDARYERIFLCLVRISKKRRES